MKGRRLRRALAILLLLVAMLVAVGWMIRRVGESRLATARVLFESEVGSLSLRDYALPRIPDERNCAVWLRRAAEALSPPQDGSESVGAILDPDWGAWSTKDLADATRWIESNRETFAQFEKCVGLEASSFGFRYEEGFDAEIPPMLDLYRSGRLVATDLRLAAAEGDVERMSRDTEILGQLSAALARESFLVSAMLHLGVERLRIAGAEDVLASATEDTSLLQELRDGLGRTESAEALRRSLAGEAAAVLVAVERRDPASPAEAPWARAAWEVFEPYRLAGLLDFYRDVALSVEGKRLDEPDDRGSRSPTAVWSIHPLVAPNILATIEKLRAVERDREQAVHALNLRLESLGYPHGS